jgi:DUF1680 family protein
LAGNQDAHRFTLTPAGTRVFWIQIYQKDEIMFGSTPWLALGMLVAVLLGTAGRAGAEVKQIQARLEPFEMPQVRLLAGPCKTAQETNKRYLLALDPERMLKNFRVNAGLPAPGTPLTGWEAPDCAIRGHYVGHYLSALALMYASTGDAAVKQRADYLIAELAKCQQALGGGYLSAFPATVWDQLEAAQPVWAQYYTIHKIMAGLLENYQHCGNTQALEIFKGLAGYFKGRLDKLSDDQINKFMAIGATEEGGISEALWNLYGVTGDENHRALAQRLEKYAFLGPLGLEHDNLSHLHGNTHIPLAVGAARHYELTGDERYRTVAGYFWERVTGTRCFATGGTTLNEIWSEPNKLADQLGYRNQECCKTYNLLKLTRHLFSWTGDAKYADYYERALFNSILGTQEQDQGMLMYYIPLATGFQKSVLSYAGHFYCCSGTGIESFAKLNDSIYFHDATGLNVNLFIASQVQWPEQGLRLEQQTTFPDEPATTLILHLSAPRSLALRIHRPAWTQAGVTVKVNGAVADESSTPSSYIVLERTWHDGDQVEVRMPMQLHTAPMPDDPELMALMYGPMVLAGITQNSTIHKPYIIAPGGNFPENDQLANYDYFLADATRLDTWIKPVAGQSLTFETVGQIKNYTFMPFARVTGERYGVYWVVTQRGSARAAKMEAVRVRAERTVDTVSPGDAVLEQAHNLQSDQSSSGPWQDQYWRDATGWWSWDLKVLPDEPMILACTYWGSDVGRQFEILVDGKVAATQQLNNLKPNEFVEVQYPLPEALTHGKQKVTVKFQGINGSLAGGVFNCTMLKVISTKALATTPLDLYE